MASNISRASSASSTGSERRRSSSIVPTPLEMKLKLPPITTSTVRKSPEREKPELTILCTKCEEDVQVRKLKEHRNFHSALQTFRYTWDNKPQNTKSLNRRRRLLMKKLNEKATHENPVPNKQVNKIDVAYEILKSDLEKNDNFTMEFVDQNTEVEEDSEKLSSALAVSVARNSNLRWRLTMEDAHVYVDNFCGDPTSGYFALFDGYSGPFAAETCAKNFHLLLQDELRKVTCWDTEEEMDWKMSAAMKSAYKNMDLTLLRGERERSHNRWSGCSAVTCLLKGKKLYVGNTGNTRALICRGNGELTNVSNLHSPRNPKERKRVKKAEGKVTKGDKTILVNGLVTTTRGLGNHGDSMLKRSVINRPVVTTVDVEDSDQFIILASNGVWEVFSENEVILLLDDILPERADMKAAAEKIMENDTDAESLKEIAAEEEKLPTLSDEKGDNSKMVTDIDLKLNLEEINNNLESVEGQNGGKQSVFQAPTREDKTVALARAMSERLVEGALLAGSHENITVMVIILHGIPLQLYLLPRISK